MSKGQVDIVTFIQTIKEDLIKFTITPKVIYIVGTVAKIFPLLANSFIFKFFFCF